jgi:hypothetical protein
MFAGPGRGAVFAGRGEAAPATLLRRAGTQEGQQGCVPIWTPDQQRTAEPVLGPREARTRVRCAAFGERSRYEIKPTQWPGDIRRRLRA